MDIWGSLSLVTSFVFIITLLLWIVINTKGKYWLKVLIIPLAIWYGLALYYAIPNLMGWPTRDELPDYGYVIGVIIDEPNARDAEGAIYLIIQSAPANEKQGVWYRLDPRNAVEHGDMAEPRVYKIDYDRFTHEKIVKNQQQQKDRGGIMLFSFSDEDGVDFKIADPTNLIRKNAE